MSGTLPIQLAQLTLDFVVDVERRLSGALAAVVAGDHELAHFVAQAGVHAGPGQPPELLLDVQRLGSGVVLLSYGPS